METDIYCVAPSIRSTSTLPICTFFLNSVVSWRRRNSKFFLNEMKTAIQTNEFNAKEKKRFLIGHNENHSDHFIVKNDSGKIP